MRATIATFAFIAVSLCGTSTAQKLRRAVAAADLVVVASVTRVIPAKTHVIHRLRVEEVLRGPVGFDAGQKIAVVVTKRVAVHNKPTPGKSMLLCLHDHDRIAKRVGLPPKMGPYYKMSGHPGSAVVLGDAPPARRQGASEHPRLAFARILIASQRGQSSRKTTEQVFALALRGAASVRTEAALTLSERSALSSCLTEVHIDKLLARTAGETDDVRYKIALASVCAGREHPALLPTLCRGAEHVGDEGYLRAIGRFARYIHRDKAHEVVLAELKKARGRTRDRLIVALGATSTEGAVEALLKMHKRGAHPSAVQAALRIHGSPRAAAAIVKKADVGNTDRPNKTDKKEDGTADEKGRKSPRQP